MIQQLKSHNSTNRCSKSREVNCLWEHIMKKLYIVGLLFLAHAASADKKELSISSLNEIAESMQKMDGLLCNADILNGQEEFYQQLRNSYEKSCNESVKTSPLHRSKECKAYRDFLAIAHPLIKDINTKQAQLQPALINEVLRQKGIINRTNDSTAEKP
jgi:hypothetical protein